MELKILKEIENPLFNRKEIEAETEVEVTPSHTEVKKAISEKLKTKPESIRVKKIDGKFGSKNFLITANVYNSEEDLKKTEHLSKKDLTREGKTEKKQVEEVPKQVEEKPAVEDKDEEPKSDEKPKEQNKLEEKPE